jgi:hypothetical protein
MSTAAQIAANIANAQSSTGPRTPEGKAAAAKNSVIHGLFSGDFIRPGEETIYATLSMEILHDLDPVGAREQILAEEIYRAAWRLRRCGEVEHRLVTRLNDGENFIQDPMEAPSPNCERIQHSVDRARSQAHRIFHKCTTELRKLQAERKAGVELSTVESTETTAETREATRTQFQPAQTPRNAQCPCGSGQKHKRCCGKEAPPVLQAA